MLICEFDRLRRAESDAAGTDPNSGGKKEDIESGDNPAREGDAEASPDSDEKLFNESQVNNIVRMRLERERAKLDKEVESRLKGLGFEDPEDAEASANWRTEKEEFLEQAAREKERLERELAERESRFDEEIDRHESEKRSWRGKYESLLVKAELTEAALKAGADPSNVDMIVTFVEGSVRLRSDGELQVVDKNGSSMLDPETGTQMTIGKFIKSFLSERPGLVRPASTKGAGTGAMGAKPARYTLDEIKEIAKADPEKYAELKKEGVVQAIYQKHLAERGR